MTWDTLEFDRSMELLYADQFSVDYDQGGYAKLTIGDADTYLVVPEGAAVPSGLPEGVTVLEQPLDSVYLVATSAMDLFRELDAMDAIRLSGTDASGWYIQEAKQAMEEGRMTYAGKYSAPDYELILASGCDLAVESTMIYHTPEVKEQLEKLGIPVLVERSSYESHPLGRMEWIKLYAVLLGKEDPHFGPGEYGKNCGLLLHHLQRCGECAQIRGLHCQVHQSGRRGIRPPGPDCG